MFMSKTENLIIIMLISVLLIPVYPSTYSSQASFSIIIKSTTTHFFIFFLTGAKDMGSYIFFPVPSPLLPPSLAIPLFALHATVPSVLTIFSMYYCYFLLEQPVGTSTEERASKTHNPSLSDATKEKNTKNTTKNNNLLFYA